jgi:hypothetical protein
VILSSTEAEYRALSDATKSEIVSLNTVLEDLGMKNPSPIAVFCDNESCIKLPSNLVYRSRTKHIWTHYYFIREKVEEGLICVQHIASIRQLICLPNH